MNTVSFPIDFAGLPDLRDIFKAMEAEHCNSFDSDIEFTTSNYKVTTRPRTEWLIVLNNDESQADMRQGRRLLKIDEIMRRTEVIAWNVSKEEIIAVVLYTGPMVNHLFSESCLFCTRSCVLC